MKTVEPPVSVAEFKVGDRLSNSHSISGIVTEVKPRGKKRFTIRWDNNHSGQYSSEELVRYGYLNQGDSEAVQEADNLQAASVVELQVGDYVYRVELPNLRLKVVEVEGDRVRVESAGHTRWRSSAELRRWEHKYEPKTWVKLKGKDYPRFILEAIHSEVADGIRLYRSVPHPNPGYPIEQISDGEISHAIDKPVWLRLGVGDRVAKDVFTGVVEIVGTIVDFFNGDPLLAVVKADDGKEIQIDTRDLAPLGIPFKLGDLLTEDLNTENAYKEGFASASAISHCEVIGFRKSSGRFYPWVRWKTGAVAGREGLPADGCLKPYTGEAELPEPAPSEPSLTAEEVIAELDRAMQQAHLKAGDYVISLVPIPGCDRNAVWTIGLIDDDGATLQLVADPDAETPVVQLSDLRLATETEIEAATLAEEGEPETPESILAEHGFIDSSQFVDSYDVGEEYRGWKIALAIPNGGVLAVDILKEGKCWGKPTEEEFGYDDEAVLNHAKSVIDQIENARLGSLDGTEQAERDRLEQVIEEGLKTFWQVGNALAEIRDQRLYRSTHSTFEDYCQDKWHFGKSNAHELIAGAKVVKNLSGIPDTPLPTSASQVRPLAKLEPEEQQQAWQEVVETAPDGKVTAAHVQQVVAKRSPEAEPPTLEALHSLYSQIGKIGKPAMPKRSQPNAFTVERDDLGNPFPLFFPGRKEAWAYWAKNSQKLLDLAARHPLPSNPTASCKACQHRNLIGDGSEFECGAKGADWTCSATRDWAAENDGCDRFKPWQSVVVKAEAEPVSEPRPEKRIPIHAFDLALSQYNKLAVHAKAAGMSMVGYLQQMVEQLSEEV